MQAWGDRETYLLDEARRDLEGNADVRPCLLAMVGDQPLMTAFLRGFARGRHLDALIEVVALAAPLGADRLALSLPGRAWYLDDPPPPILRDVIVLEEVDAAAGPPRSTSSAFGYHLDGSGLRWAAPLRHSGLSGSTSTALLVAVRERHRLRATDAELRQQAARCVLLGHLVAFARPVFQRLAAP